MRLQFLIVTFLRCCFKEKNAHEASLIHYADVKQIKKISSLSLRRCFFAKTCININTILCLSSHLTFNYSCNYCFLPTSCAPSPPPTCSSCASCSGVLFCILNTLELISEQSMWIKTLYKERSFVWESIFVCVYQCLCVCV